MANVAAVQIVVDQSMSDEIRTLRAALEELNPAAEGFGEAFDWLRTRGLLIEVPSDEAFRAEWGDVESMYVWRWRAGPPDSVDVPNVTFPVAPEPTEP